MSSELNAANFEEYKIKLTSFLGKVMQIEFRYAKDHKLLSNMLKIIMLY